jgi:hypothetical protein
VTVNRATDPVTRTETTEDRSTDLPPSLTSPSRPARRVRRMPRSSRDTFICDMPSSSAISFWVALP